MLSKSLAGLMLATVMLAGTAQADPATERALGLNEATISYAAPMDMTDLEVFAGGMLGDSTAMMEARKRLQQSQNATRDLALMPSGLYPAREATGS
ncbi:hypothetical protein [Halomonas saccharevitans]|uniref:Uncharacterized protein n=1 Tax=Halomonas saccharevitans TaxID=416872 RepID=A0A1I7BSQ7_9GAMM|nr:hypothetical protein [Halomonas saccharevitans]SFT90230.1 hypothetical protein SAMN04487956_1303 [Halomonas saccharevitans]